MSLIDFANSATAKVILAAVAVWAGWTAQGWRKNSQIAHMEKQIAEERADAALDLVAALKLASQVEKESREKLEKNATELKKGIADAKADRDRFIDGVRNGTIRLSIPVIAGNDNATGDPATADRDRHETRAELDPAAGQSLAAIAGDGDDGIRQLNSCIDSYNAVRERFNRLLKGEHVQAE